MARAYSEGLQNLESAMARIVLGVCVLEDILVVSEERLEEWSEVGDITNCSAEEVHMFCGLLVTY